MLGPALVSAVGLLTILLLSVGVHGAREVHPIPTLLLTWAFLERALPLPGEPRAGPAATLVLATGLEVSRSKTA